MENKSKGKVVVITIVILALLGAIGYLIYDKNNTEKKITDYETQLKDLKKEIKEHKEDTKDLETIEQSTQIAGYYKWGQTFSTDANPCDPENLSQKHGKTVEIFLKEDGTYLALYGADCGGQNAGAGTYTISGNKLIAKCSGIYEACVGQGEYQINEFGNLINNDQEIFAKIDKARLQFNFDSFNE